MKPKTLDLFCGAGGLSLGFEMAGFEILAGIDIEKTFLKSFDMSHPDTVAINEDLSKDQIKTILKDAGVDWKEVEMVIGGPPCQGFSTVGNRMVEDPRNMLVKEYARVISQIKPKMFLMENVSGLASMKNGLDQLVVEELLDFFKEIGYATSFKILKAADYGVPQLRKRIFFVGLRNDLDGTFKWPKPTHYPPESVMAFKSNVKKYVTVMEALSDLPKIESDEESKVYASDPLNEYQKWIRGECSELDNHKAPRHSDLVLDRIRNIPPGGNHSNLPEHLKLKRGYPNIYGKLRGDKPADTITGNFGCASAPGRFLHPQNNRVLTVREGARLQSFPDRVKFYGNLSQRYKQVGNAVPPLLAKSVAECIKKTFYSV